MAALFSGLYALATRIWDFYNYFSFKGLNWHT